MSGQSYGKQSTPKLAALDADIYNPDIRLMFIAGLPSTGKSKRAAEGGIGQVLKTKRYKKVVIIRPVIIPECGLLKGDLNDKMSPYVRQAEEYITEGTPYQPEELILKKKLEIWPADLLQGNRFRDSFVIFDEVQNIHMEKTFAYASRIGEGSKFLFIGDISKGQQNSKIKDKSLLHYAMTKFADKEYCRVHTFYDEEDILGDPITKDIIKTLLPDFCGISEREW